MSFRSRTARFRPAYFTSRPIRAPRSRPRPRPRPPRPRPPPPQRRRQPRPPSTNNTHASNVASSSSYNRYAHHRQRYNYNVRPATSRAYTQQPKRERRVDNAYAYTSRRSRNNSANRSHQEHHHSRISAPSQYAHRSQRSSTYRRNKSTRPRWSKLSSMSHYTVLKSVGKGTFGTVRKGIHKLTGIPVRLHAVILHFAFSAADMLSYRFLLGGH